MARLDCIVQVVKDCKEGIPAGHLQGCASLRHGGHKIDGRLTALPKARTSSRALLFLHSWCVLVPGGLAGEQSSQDMVLLDLIHPVRAELSGLNPACGVSRSPVRPLTCADTCT